MNQDEYWIREALALAELGAAVGEVPVGALVVYNNQIVGRGYNSPIGRNNPVAHAEILAIQDAAKTLGNYRLLDCDLYVTLEPCGMCAGAMVHSRIRRLIYGATEPKAGAVISQDRALERSSLNHFVEITGGVLTEECSTMLSAFFKKRRQQKKEQRRQQQLLDQVGSD
ncbi:tRNA adenosine(34) deaminase TadA [Sansalvadorimonas sp. 2012CJ34-2]|uniref:tRNA-specific adenosine deaminase n=1 Tax=Parendozoicomonas callyspongiae TaxID=2942213 RepID=A0ABT0PDZ5_9GAMM|nr:tRNA adenosine(34) deaminase TadA [Sansalvadorimonas sp. 2012CJ34-2]MCL6269597.1 tRNA adenosine(34) deaminase TadA [Sansalvadorimonas sp. 2012CJ34-2]